MAMHLLRAVALGAALTLSPTAYAAGQHHHHDDPIGAPGKPDAVSRSIRIEMHDDLFAPIAVAVAAGETVRFVLHNAGGSLHEFSIGTAHMHEEHRAQMQEMMDRGMITETRIVPEKMHAMAHDHANSVLVEPGETAELIWRFDKAAKLEFACNMPGHYEAGMSGAIQFHK